MLDDTDFSSFWYSVSTLLAFATLIALILVPVYMYKITKIYYEKWDSDEAVHSKYETLFGDK